ncbi:MAG: ATP-binding protein [bacterium]
MLFAGLTVIVLSTGGFGLSAPFALAIVPMLAVLFGSRRLGLAWTALVLAEVGLLSWLHARDYPFPARPEGLPGPFEAVQGLFWVLVVLCLLALMFGWRSQALLDDLSRAYAALDRLRELAQTASLSKDRFLANMSHEIRTPMNGVMGSLDLLREGELDPEQRKAAEVAHRSAQALLYVLGDIVDIARVESGALTLDVRPFDVAAVVEEVADLFRVEADEKDLTLTVEVEPTLPARFVGDGHRLRQVLVNLIGNAVKFTPEGRVHVRLTRGDDGGIRVTVRDTGIGIAPADRDRIFEPFVQADASTTRRFGGTGLGLAISRQIAQRLGGTLTVQSAPGEGSTFTLALPLAPTGTDRPLAATPAGGTPRSFQGCRVLLVEDNPINRLVVEEMLRRLGCRITVAEDGEDALRHVAERFDIVLMDCQMPRMDGYEATRALRGRGVDGPIVALTAHAMEGDRERCIAAGMDDYVTKPLSRDGLVAVMDRWIPAL